MATQQSDQCFQVPRELHLPVLWTVAPASHAICSWGKQQQRLLCCRLCLPPFKPMRTQCLYSCLTDWKGRNGLQWRLGYHTAQLSCSLLGWALNLSEVTTLHQGDVIYIYVWLCSTLFCDLGIGRLHNQDTCHFPSSRIAEMKHSGLSS